MTSYTASFHYRKLKKNTASTAVIQKPTLQKKQLLAKLVCIFLTLQKDVHESLLPQ